MEAAAVVLNAYVLVTALITIAVLAHFRGRDWFVWLCLCGAITPLWALVLVLGLPPVKLLDKGKQAGMEGIKIAAYVVLTLLAATGVIVLIVAMLDGMGYV